MTGYLFDHYRSTAKRKDRSRPSRSPRYEPDQDQACKKERKDLRLWDDADGEDPACVIDADGSV